VGWPRLGAGRSEPGPRRPQAGGPSAPHGFWTIRRSPAARARRR